VNLTARRPSSSRPERKWPRCWAQAQPPVRRALAAYGRHLGTAYQLVDDVLDYRSTPQERGKNLGDDLAEGKPTLPLNPRAQERQRSTTRGHPPRDRAGGPEQLELVVAAMRIHRRPRSTPRASRVRSWKRALTSLGALPDSSYKDGLAALARFASSTRREELEAGIGPAGQPPYTAPPQLNGVPMNNNKQRERVQESSTRGNPGPPDRPPRRGLDTGAVRGSGRGARNHRPQGGARVRLDRHGAEGWRDRVVRGDHIVSVGTAAPPAGARIIALGDATLCPAFIDAHTHLTLELQKDYYRFVYNRLMRFPAEQGLLGRDVRAPHAGGGVRRAQCRRGRLRRRRRCATPSTPGGVTEGPRCLRPCTASAHPAGHFDFYSFPPIACGRGVRSRASARARGVP